MVWPCCPYFLKRQKRNLVSVDGCIPQTQSFSPPEVQSPGDGCVLLQGALSNILSQPGGRGRVSKPGG